MNSRAKGKRSELELAKALREYGYDARRGQQYSGVEGEDVIGLPHIHIECKNVDRESVRKWMEQSKRDAREDQIPVVIHKKNRSPWLVTLDLDQWMRMYRAWEKEWTEE